MRWTPGDRSNIEDMRGRSGIGMRAGGLGIGGVLVLLLLSWATGVDFLSLLGGGFFPVDFTPAGFQSITKLIPTGMVNLALTHCLTGRPLGVSLPVMFALCGGFFVAGILMSRKRIL